MATPEKHSPFEVRHPFFRPFWRRFVLTAAILLWALYELMNEQMIWAALFGAAGLYLLIQFFFKFDPADYEASTKDDTDGQ